jgi:putative hydrolase of the HAD superfamily
MIKWLVFDLGDVVLKRTEALPDLARLLDAPPERVQSAYWTYRRQYDGNSDASAFWSAVAQDAGAAQPDAELIAELVRLDDAGWAVADEDVLTLIDDAVRAGIQLAVLSNAPSSMGRLITAMPWASVFDPLLFSGDLGMLKPEERIYRQLLDRLQAEPAEVAFLDDRLDNVEGATAIGIHAVQFTGVAAARDQLARLGLPIPAAGEVSGG